MSYKNIHPFQPGLRTIYVNHTSGNDGYAGTISEPVGTIQEAVNRFKPLDRGVQAWDLNDDRTIIVQDPGGTHIFNEEITIPPHSGDGALIIKAEYNVVFSGLTEAGTPFSALSGYEVRQRLTFTTTPMTPGTLNDGYFAIADTNYLGNPFEYGWDYLPIVYNGDGYVDVVALDPGTWTAFNHFAGATVDIAEPVVIWQPATTDGSAYYTTQCIRNLGGALIVEGFRFQPYRTSLTGSVISNIGQIGESTNGTRVTVRGCIFEDNSGTGFATIAIGDACSLLGCIFTTSATDFVNYTKGLSVVNNRIKSTYSLVQFGYTEATIWGIDVELDGSSDTFYIKSSNLIRFFADIRAANIRFVDSYCFIEALTVEGAGALPAIDIGSNCSIDITTAITGSRLSGSTGNNSYGLQITNANSEVRSNTNPTTATITGTSGDVKIGDNPVRAWTAGAETDLTKLARLGGW